MFRTPVRLRAAGRTDAGVHATGQVAHVDVPADALPHAYPRTDAPQGTASSCRWCDGCRGSCLPMSGCATSSAPPAGFDARFSALRRHYEYRLSTAPYGVEPQEARYVTPWPRPLDVDAMSAASRELVGLHDFAAFCRHREGATTIRDLQRLDWSRDGDLVTAYVSADAFCWSMVRSLVGALVGGRGGPPRTRLGAQAVDVDTALQRLRGGAAAGPDARRRGLPARRPTRGAHHGHPRAAAWSTRSVPATKSAAWFDHARLDVCLGERGAGQLSSHVFGSAGLQIGSAPWHNSMVRSRVERAEVRDGSSPRDAVAEQGDRGDVLIHARRQRDC